MTTRRRFIGGAALASLGAATRLSVSAAATPAARWAPYRNAFVIDGASGAELLETKPDDADFADMLRAWRASGITSVIATIPPAAGPRYTDQQFEAAKRCIADWNAGIERQGETLLLVRNAADLERARREHRTGLVYTFQGAEPIADDLDRVATFHDSGVRVIQLTHNKRNLVGDGCLEPGNAGLSRFGHALVERLNERKILVDLAHGAQRTTREGILASKQPVLISHSGCRALADVTRLTSDAELKLLADRGGVVGIMFWPYLRVRGQQTSADVIRHIEHAIDVCGEDHVGIGTDVRVTPEKVTPEYRQANTATIKEFIQMGVFASDRDPDLLLFPPDLNVPDRMDVLAAMLSARGFRDERIGKVLGGNFARVMREVWG